jgi:hypothetical protein
MRTEAHKIKMVVVRLSVDQNQIRFDVAIPMIGPFTRERMIEITMWQRFINHKQFENCFQVGIKRFAMPA